MDSCGTVFYLKNPTPPGAAHATALDSVARNFVPRTQPRPSKRAVREREKERPERKRWFVWHGMFEESNPTDTGCIMKGIENREATSHDSRFDVLHSDEL